MSEECSFCAFCCLFTFFDLTFFRDDSQGEAERTREGERMKIATDMKCLRYLSVEQSDE